MNPYINSKPMSPEPKACATSAKGPARGQIEFTSLHVTAFSSCTTYFETQRLTPAHRCPQTTMASSQNGPTWPSYACSEELHPLWRRPFSLASSSRRFVSIRRSLLRGFFEVLLRTPTEARCEVIPLTMATSYLNARTFEDNLYRPA